MTAPATLARLSRIARRIFGETAAIVERPFDVSTTDYKPTAAEERRAMQDPNCVRTVDMICVEYTPRGLRAELLPLSCYVGRAEAMLRERLGA